MVPNIPGACIWPDRALLPLLLQELCGKQWRKCKDWEGEWWGRKAVANMRSTCCHPTITDTSAPPCHFPVWPELTQNPPLSGYQNWLWNFQLQISWLKATHTYYLIVRWIRSLTAGVTGQTNIKESPGLCFFLWTQENLLTCLFQLLEAACDSWLMAPFSVKASKGSRCSSQMRRGCHLRGQFLSDGIRPLLLSPFSTLRTLRWAHSLKKSRIKSPFQDLNLIISAKSLGEPVFCLPQPYCVLSVS